MLRKYGRVLALIPARSGSKRLPGKNQIEFAGAPLVSWTVRFAVESGRFEKVVLSTDSLEIASIGENYGAQAFPLRPLELSTDAATTSSVIRHELDVLKNLHGFSFDVVVVLQPTSPIRRLRDLDTVIGETFSNHGVDGILTIAKSHLHPRHLKRFDGGVVVPYFSSTAFETLWDTHSDAYSPTGSLYSLKTKAFLANSDIYSLKLGGVQTPAYCNIDIDTAEDLKVAEAVILDERFLDVFR